MAASSTRLNLLGSPTVTTADGGTQALPFERRTQLVALLALRRAWVPRVDVAAMLWPDQEARLAFANVRKTLFRMASLPLPAPIETHGAALRLDVDTDVRAFEDALAAGRTADALAIHRGDLLAGFDDGQSESWSQWVAFERERLRSAWRAAALAVLDGDGIAPSDAIALSARLLEADPLDETAQHRQMRALARDGQAGAARAAYRRFAERLAAELGLMPGVELRALHESLSGPAAASPAATTLGAAPGPADDGFIGRSIELQRIVDQLARPGCRLLCLIGPGGVGKTRLARRVVDALASSRQDGALFVSLEDVDSPQQLALRLASVAGVGAGRGDDDPWQRVVAHWRDRDTLLALDNFEQLAEHSAQLDRLLGACPLLKILVTSRVRLAVAAEWSMPIEGLPWPDPEDSDRAESFDAVRLFVKAARRVDPGFAAAAERAAIVDICRQVEGLPLAIELAAAWVRVVPCRTIADELVRGTELLRATDSRYPSRQASIEAVFEHSWGHLSLVEREALARLSVCHGGFSIEAARAVAAASLPVLGALADKSLLTRDGERMRLHPLVQQLASLRLGSGAARAATEAAHAAYYHRWLQRLAPASERGQREALQAIDVEYENCRSAWRHSIEQGDVDALLRSMPVLVHRFEHRARFDEGLALLQAAIDAPACAADGPLQAALLSQQALLQMRLGRFAEAEATATRAYDAAREAAHDESAFGALFVLGGCALNTRDPADAIGFYRRALESAQTGGRVCDVAAALDNLSLCEKRLGRYGEALTLALEALAEHRRHGDAAKVALCLSNLASLRTFLDDDAAAEAHLHEALQISESHGLVSTHAFVLANLTELASKRGDVRTANGHAERALAIARGGRLRALEGWLTVQLARFALRRGEHARARSLLAEGADLALVLGAQYVKAAAMLAWAELLESLDRADVARRVLAFAADEPSLSAPDRDELRAAWMRRATAAAPDPPWPPIALDELLRRIVAEHVVDHAPLIAALRQPQPQPEPQPHA